MCCGEKEIPRSLQRKEIKQQVWHVEKAAQDRPGLGMSPNSTARIFVTNAGLPPTQANNTSSAPEVNNFSSFC